MSPDPFLLGIANQPDANGQIHQSQPDALVDDISALEPAGQVVFLLTLPCVSATRTPPMERQWQFSALAC